ncbi:hypothetical protein FIE12Z_8549 [Fusarium flagelliforme]|uniref:Uncharacterized protein n=1 Tax=Fusarium flagelliforme TaxID=2675880 RepID=A0A395MH33_9HYPO|nr:hypothetical protein FIE12Z_8549 [Fusarium flagelliforme]
MAQILGGMTCQAPGQGGPGLNSSDPGGVEAITQVLSDYLKTEQPESYLSKAPNGFDDALKELDASDSISLAFRRRGFWPWLAYSLADNIEHLDETLRRVSPDDLSNIVDNVSKVSVAPSLVQRIEHTLWSSKRKGRRRALLERAGIFDFPCATSSMSLPSPPSNAQKRPRAPSLDDPDEITDVTSETTQTDNVNRVRNTPRPTAGLHVHDHASQPIFIVDPQCNYSYPNASTIPLVFEQELGDIIVRSGYTASIFASFPPDPAECRLWLNVEASAVVPLAMKLYGIQIVEMEQQRAFTLPGGASVGIIGSVKLTKTKASLWDDLLGNLILPDQHWDPWDPEEEVA